MQIPKKVRVGRSDYHILELDEAHKKEYGHVQYGNRTIVIYQPAHSETFWHELTHAILHEMDNPLHKNEQFVSKFAKLLDTAVSSARF